MFNAIATIAATPAPAKTRTQFAVGDTVSWMIGSDRSCGVVTKVTKATVTVERYRATEWDRRDGFPTGYGRECQPTGSMTKFTRRFKGTDYECFGEAGCSYTGFPKLSHTEALVEFSDPSF